MNRKKFFSLFGILITTAMICSIFASLTVSAVTVPKSTQAKINDIIQKHEAQTPSVSVTVFNDKQNICSVVYGKSDMENNITADENTVYEWGSVSKLLVWTSAMQLYEQGKLNLNKDIRSYLPDGFLTKLKYDTPITMLDLMNHSAGFLSPYKEMETDDIDKILPLETALREIEPVQDYPPGETVAYSNYGAALAGYTIECISGMDYADYVKQNIFDRLGMKHTAIRPDLSDNEWVSLQRKKTHCYVEWENKMESLQECRRYIHIYPAGSACGTVSDFALFARAFLSDSQQCPLFDKATTLDEMLSPSMYFADGKTPRFCHGLMVEKAGLATIGHGGNTEGFTSLLQLDVKEKTGFVMMTNKQHDRIYGTELVNALYGKPDISSFKEDGFQKYDFSGQYRITGGTFETGCFSLYGFLADKFDVHNQDGIFKGSLGVKVIRQISDHAAVMELVTGDENLFFIRTDQNGAFAGFQNESFDFVKMNDFDYYCGWTATILLAVGLGLMVLMIIFHAIRLGKFARNLVLRYRKKYLWSWEKSFELPMCCIAAAIAGCIFLLSQFGMSDEIVRMCICILIAVLTIVLLIMNIICHVKKPQSVIGIVLWTEHICSIFIAVGVVYWRLFQFRGF